MEFQYFGRQQRPKGANIKKALQLILLLVVCAWLVYQINHSRNTAENYGAVLLGRKGTPSSWLDQRTLPNSGNVHSVEAKSTNSGRGDLSDGAVEDKAEAEFGHIHEKFKAIEKKPENQSKASHKFKDSGKVHERSRRSESDDKGQGNKEYPKVPVINDSQSTDKEPEVQIRESPNDVQIRKKKESDDSIKENEEVVDQKISDKEVKMQEIVVDSVPNVGLIDRIDGVHSFHDENGVPPEVNENDPIDGQAHVLNEENISNYSKESRLRKSNIYEVTSASASSEDNRVEMTSEGSTRDAIADGEINSRSTTHVDT